MKAEDLDRSTILEQELVVRTQGEQREAALREQLLQSERLAMVGKMAAQVAHEIRNPLSSIGLNVELLADEIRRSKIGTREEVKGLFTSILSEIDRLNTVIEEYLQFARLPHEDRTVHSLTDLLTDVLGLMEREAINQGICLIRQLTGSSLGVFMDEKQIRQAMINIIRNAFQAMPQGGGLEVEAAPQGNMAEVRLRDTGIGIPEEQLPLVFHPFFTTKPMGTGLGLTYAQQVIQEHQGSIALESICGGGTTVTFRLPLAEESNPSNPESLTTSSESELFSRTPNPESQTPD